MTIRAQKVVSGKRDDEMNVRMMSARGNAA